MHLHGHPVMFPFAGITILAACTAGDTGNGAATVRDSAGVSIVHSSGGLWSGPPPLVTEVVRIGAVEGADHLQFHRILTIDVDAGGTIFVGNDQTGTVRVFGRDGTFLHEFGGKGNGPGEYQELSRVMVADDRVVVSDLVDGGRHGVYDRDGTLMAFWTGAQIGGGRVSLHAMTPFAWIAIQPPADLPSLAPGETFEYRTALVRVDPEAGTIGDTLFHLPGQKFYGGYLTPLFDPPKALAIDDTGRLYLSLGDPYRIEVLAPGADMPRAYRLQRIITRDIEGVPVSDPDIEVLKARIASRYDTMTTVPAERRTALRDRAVSRIDERSRLVRRSTLPPLGRLLVSPDGSFWVERIDTVSPADFEYGRITGAPLPTRWDLFDEQGRFLVQVELDPRFTPFAARGTEITGVLKDQLDVEFVVTYRIEQQR